jgi:hypothetical protein
LGAFVGPLPSRVHATLRITGPIGAGDEQPFRQLAEAGFTSATLALDVGTEWNAESRAIVLSPGLIQVTNVASAEVKATLGNVQSTMFSTDPTAILIGSIQVELGPMEVTLHDLGGLDLVVTQIARARKLSPDAARQVLVETLTQPLASFAATNADFAALAEAVAKFAETPGGTLRVTATPKGRVTLMQAMAALKEAPATAFADFRVEATVSK